MAQIEDIHRLLEKAKSIQKSIGTQERDLALAKLELRELTETTIPDLMREIGLEAFTTSDGEAVSLERFYAAKIPSTREIEAFQWLEDTGNGAIVKNEVLVSMKKSEQDTVQKAIEALREAGIPFAQKMSVHPATLKAFVKERIESGAPIPLETFGVYIGERITVRPPR